MDGDGEDSVDFSSDGDVVGDATMLVLNVLGRPKWATGDRSEM